MLEQAGPINSQHSYPSLSSLVETHTESCGDTDDNALALELLGEVDLVARGVLDQHVQIGNGISLLHKGGCSVVEEGGLGTHTREVGSDTTSSEHGELVDRKGNCGRRK